MRAAVAKYVPALKGYFQQAYDQPVFIECGNSRTKSSRGGFQGDPLMPALFALALVDVDKALDAAGLTMRFWYLDDFVALGTPESLEKALRILNKKLPEIGIRLNVSKSHTFGAGEHPAPTMLQHYSWDRFMILGTAIDSNAAFVEKMAEYSGEIVSLRKSFQDMDAQVGATKRYAPVAVGLCRERE